MSKFNGQPLTTYCYPLIVEEDADDHCIARIGDRDDPLVGYGDSPLEALRDLCEKVKEWPVTGAELWLNSDEGRALAKSFGVDIKEGAKA